MKKVTIAIIAVAVLATGAIFAIAQRSGGMGHGFGRHGHEMGGMFLRGLNLTDEQKAQAKQITEASKEKVQPIREAMKANHDKLKETTATGAFDEAQVSGIAKSQGDLAAQLIVERERTRSQIFAILTDEQKAKAEDLRAKFGEHFKGRKGFEGKQHGEEF